MTIRTTIIIFSLINILIKLYLYTLINPLSIYFTSKALNTNPS
jgi:hypothetical protein